MASDGDFARGVEAYRAGDFGAAVLAWERLFQAAVADEPLRTLLQALLQTTGALVRLGGRESTSGAEKLLARAAQKLEGLPDAYMGLSIARFREGLASCRAEVARLVGLGRRDIDPIHAPPLEDAGDPAEPDVASVRAVEPGPADRIEHFGRALVAYRAGAFFEARGLWEELWRSEPDALHKGFLQALLQLAAAMHKLDEGNARAAAHLLGRAHLRLDEVPEGYGGIAIGALREGLERARNELAKVHVVGGPSARALAPPIVPRPASALN
jgi:predicted metal-dependent hydrolase